MQTATNLQQDQKQQGEQTLIKRESRWREKENWHQLAKRHGAAAGREHEDSYGVTTKDKEPSKARVLRRRREKTGLALNEKNILTSDPIMRFLHHFAVNKS